MRGNDHARTLGQFLVCVTTTPSKERTRPTHRLPTQPQLTFAGVLGLRVRGDHHAVGAAGLVVVALRQRGDRAGEVACERGALVG